MYNRYVPQPDGSHCRNRVPEPPTPAQNLPHPTPVPPVPNPACTPLEEPPCAPPLKPPPPKNSHCRPTCPREPESIPGFLRRLLPKDLDTGDLLILLLLLVMAGDREENKTNALLTIALYFLL